MRSTNRIVLLVWGLLFVVSNVLFVCWGNNGGNRVAAVEKRLAFAEEELDLGRFLKGERIEFSLQLSNLGSEILKIDSVRGDCSCTDVKAASDTILAHGTVAVSGAIRPRAEVGEYQHQIQVKSSSTVLEVVTCRLSYRVASRFTVQPSIIECKTSLFSNGPEVSQFTLTNDSGSEVTFQNAHVDIEGVAVRLDRNATRPGSSCILNVSVNESRPVGRSGMISVATSHPDEPLLRLPLRVQPIESVVVVPPSVDWGLVYAADAAIRTKTVRLCGQLLAESELVKVVLPDFVRQVRTGRPSATMYDVVLEIDRSVYTEHRLNLSSQITFEWCHIQSTKEFEVVVPVTGYFVVPPSNL